MKLVLKNSCVVIVFFVFMIFTGYLDIDISYLSGKLHVFLYIFEIVIVKFTLDKRNDVSCKIGIFHLLTVVFLLFVGSVEIGNIS